MKKNLAIIFLFVNILTQQVYSQESLYVQGVSDSCEVMKYELDKLRASTYLNECAYSLTKILESGNKIVLLDEQYKLNNTYKWENITDYSSVFKFRQSLQSQLNELIINETNRERFKKEFERKKNAAARDAFLNVISGVQFNVNMVSIVSNVLISSARAYMEYGQRKENLAVELDEDIWNLEQNHMNAITLLRNDLFDVINQTFGQYKISDQMYLRENDFKNFFNILAIKDSELRLVSLKENQENFQSFSPYWFELGCTCIDNYENTNNSTYLQEAWINFDIYEKFNKDCPLFITDERIGIIALYRLRYIKGLNKEEIVSLLDVIKKNISKDASALLFASLQYANKLSSPNSALNMMRQCLANQSITGKNEFILAASSIWDKVSDLNTKKLFIKAVSNTEDIDLDTYIAFLYQIRKDKDIDVFPLMHKLQSSLSVKIKEYDDDCIEKLSIICNNKGYFKYDNSSWKICIEDRDIVTHKTRRYDTNLSFSEPDKFFSTLEEIRDEIASENDYFDEHSNEIDKAHIISKVYNNGKQYYYISAKSKWEEIMPSLSYKTSDNQAEEYNITANIENEYIEFFNEYAVQNINYDFIVQEAKEMPLETLYNEPRYTLKLLLLDKENARVELLFTTDFISENNTLFYLSGFTYNNEFIRF